jgi:hypothetical protein
MVLLVYVHEFRYTGQTSSILPANKQPFSHNLKTAPTFLFKAVHLVTEIAYMYGTKV